MSQEGREVGKLELVIIGVKEGCTFLLAYPDPISCHRTFVFEVEIERVGSVSDLDARRSAGDVASRPPYDRYQPEGLYDISSNEQDGIQQLLALS